jgi:hypothetical protein
MIAVHQYECEICHKRSDDRETILACEARGVEKPIVKVGDIVFMGAGFGWFDGDPAWVNNPDVRGPGGRNGDLTVKPKPCPKGDSNCFDSCCNFRFYYVVTAIDTVKDHGGFGYQSPGHRTRYHVETLAMTGRQGHRGPKFTFASDHVRPKVVKDPPEAVVRASKKLIGHVAEHLF